MKANPAQIMPIIGITISATLAIQIILQTRFVRWQRIRIISNIVIMVKKKNKL